MNAIRFQQSNTLVCLMSVDDDAGDRAALELARLFGSTCEALLIVDPDPRLQQPTLAPPDRVLSRRSRKLSYLAREMGLSIQVEISELSPGLNRLRQQSRETMTILMQPAHPLSRQTHTFRTVQLAAEQTLGATLFSPPVNVLSRDAILAICLAPEDPAVDVARQLAAATHHPMEIIRPSRTTPHTATALAQDLSAWTGPRAPSLIVMNRGELLQAASDYSSLAARLNTPILVVSAPNDSQSNGDTPGRESKPNKTGDTGAT